MYIKDNKIYLKEKDYLKSSIYVDALIEIRSSCPTPFAIGLFGGWRIGKTSIVFTLSKLDEQNLFSGFHMS